jgi:hypothetical protein
MRYGVEMSRFIVMLLNIRGRVVTKSRVYFDDKK